MSTRKDDAVSESRSGSDLTASDGSLENGFVVPVIAEELVVTKRLVPLETVRVIKTREGWTERMEVPLVEERWEITRLPKEIEVAARYEQHQDGETTIFPRFEERLITRKAIFLVEEIYATKIIETRTEIVEADLIREIVSVQRGVSPTES